MTLEHLFSLLPRLKSSDAYEILAASRYPTLEAWASSRVELPGCAWAAFDEAGEVQACGGVLEGAVEGIGIMWIVSSNHLMNVAVHMLRIWHAIVEHGGFRRLECKCYAANGVANRFAQRLGFKFEGLLRGYTRFDEDLNQYGLLIGGAHGR